ncbi:MAG: RidA family protein [Gammaproteobacteria bacterium]|nr:RidA family protein [Gammaproteobacteria bacterium]
MSNTARQTFSTETQWEEIAGFSRALRVGNHIFVAGTTATGPEGVLHKNDAAKQMIFILDRIEHAIVKLGGTLENVVRTRIYVNDINDWEVVAKIHGEKFRAIKPVNTLVQAKLVGECLVEVEAEAVL